MWPEPRAAPASVARGRAGGDGRWPGGLSIRCETGQLRTAASNAVARTGKPLRVAPSALTTTIRHAVVTLADVVGTFQSAPRQPSH